MSRQIKSLLIQLLVSLAGMKALFHPGLFTAHDIWHQVVRFYYYSAAINDGQFPPYWISQLANGYGYPLFLFSYHLPWLIGVLLLKVGFSFSGSIKLLFFLSYLLSGFTMYFLTSSLLKNKLSALLVSILYLWLPYHFLITFVSASLGIAFVFTFLPMIFWGIHLNREKEKAGIPILAIGIAGVILSHIMHLIFLLPAILVFLIWEINSIKSKLFFIKNLLLGITLAIFISSFYLLPALLYNQTTKVHQETGITKLYERNFINLNQLMYSKWGFSPIINNAKTGEISFQLGIAQWLSIFSLLIMLLRKKSLNQKSLITYLSIAIFVNILLMLDISSSIWKQIIRIVALDFPFRLILPASFMASLGAGIILLNLPKKMRYVFFICLITIAIYTNRNHLNINQYTNFPISTYLNLETETTTNTFNEYLPIQANPKLLGKPWNEATGSSITSYNTKQSTNQLSFNVKALKNTNISIGQFYFPGQSVYIDNKPGEFKVDQEGLISFDISQGTHSILIKYQPSLLIKVSIIFTLAGLILTAILLGKNISFKKLASKYT